MAQGKKVTKSGRSPMGKSVVRTTIRIPGATAARVEYWSSKLGLTETDFMAEAIEEKIARINGDYDLPTLEQARLVQIQDLVKSLAVTNEQLEITLTKGFDSLLGLARGDNNYLQDDVSGEIDDV